MVSYILPPLINPLDPVFHPLQSKSSSAIGYGYNWWPVQVTQQFFFLHYLFNKKCLLGSRLWALRRVQTFIKYLNIWRTVKEIRLNSTLMQGGKLKFSVNSLPLPQGGACLPHSSASSLPCHCVIAPLRAFPHPLQTHGPYLPLPLPLLGSSAI